MADFTVSRPGQINLATGSAAADTALFLKLYAGEVLTTFARENIMLPLSQVRTIPNGKSASFPVTGTAVAAYHTPGAEIAGQQIKGNERIISIDSLLTAPVFIANIDEAMNHYDVRSIYTTEAGRALSKACDVALMRTVALCARAAATITTVGKTGAPAITDASMKTTIAKLKAGIISSAQRLDENDVPSTERYCILAPAQYYLLITDTDIMNKQWDGNGSVSQGYVNMLSGISIRKSNNLPTDNYAGVSGEVNSYVADMTKTAALVFHRSAVGTVKLLDLAVESEYETRYQGTLIVAKYAMGHGILRPEAAVELATS